MYVVSVSQQFQATHRVRLPTVGWEESHSHDWKVSAEFRSEELDALDMVVDFEHAQRVLSSIMKELDQRDLNQLPAFSGVIPTAERVARYILLQIQQAGLQCISRVSVVEAPGCIASYEVT